MGFSRNKFFERDGYMVGVTKKGIEFTFDKEDFELVSQYTWYITKQGYVCNKTGKVAILLHRLIMKVCDDKEVDHKDLNPLNNRKDNLRICTHTQNMSNLRKPRVKSTSKYKGVYLAHGKWRAQISINDKITHIGVYLSEKEAALAYNKRALEVYGEFARLNDVC